MTIAALDVRACPHCGGEIKTIAKLCRHCRRTVDAPVAPITPVAAPLAVRAPPTPVLPPVVQELRKFVVGKQLVAGPQLDPFLAARSVNDAGVLLRQMAVVGMLTRAQAEAAIVEFHQAQLARAKVLVDHAIARGLVPASHAAHAYASYANAALIAPIDEHLRAIGLLTADQAIAMKGREIPWQAVAAMLVGGGLLIVFGVSVYKFTRNEPPKITSDCTMNGLGVGQCTFTNRGGEAGAQCGFIAVHCGDSSKYSVTFCSGEVAVNATTPTVEFQVPGLDGIIVEWRDWRSQCKFDFIEEAAE